MGAIARGPRTPRGGGRRPFGLGWAVAAGVCESMGFSLVAGVEYKGVLGVIRSGSVTKGLERKEGLKMTRWNKTLAGVVVSVALAWALTDAAVAASRRSRDGGQTVKSSTDGQQQGLLPQAAPAAPARVSDRSAPSARADVRVPPARESVRVAPRDTSVSDRVRVRPEPSRPTRVDRSATPDTDSRPADVSRSASRQRTAPSSDVAIVLKPDKPAAGNGLLASPDPPKRPERIDAGPRVIRDRASDRQERGAAGTGTDVAKAPDSKPVPADTGLIKAPDRVSTDARDVSYPRVLVPARKARDRDGKTDVRVAASHDKLSPAAPAKVSSATRIRPADRRSGGATVVNGSFGSHETSVARSTVVFDDDHERWHHSHAGDDFHHHPVYHPVFACPSFHHPWWHTWCRHRPGFGFGIGWTSRHWSILIWDWWTMPCCTYEAAYYPAVVEREVVYVDRPVVRVVDTYDDIDKLIDALKYGDTQQRRDAARQLGYEGSLRALYPLTYALESDVDATVRYHAAKSLGKLGSHDALPALRKAIVDDPDEVVRSEAQDAVDAILTD